MYGEIRDEDDEDENEGVEADEDVKLTANVSWLIFFFFWQLKDGNVSLKVWLRWGKLCISLTHINVVSQFWDIGKHCRPRSDATESGVWSGSSLFANRNIYSK